jgi:hypothetical protein
LPNRSRLATRPCASTPTPPSSSERAWLWPA